MSLVQPQQVLPFKKLKETPSPSPPIFFQKQYDTETDASVHAKLMSRPMAVRQAIAMGYKLPSAGRCGNDMGGGGGGEQCVKGISLGKGVGPVVTPWNVKIKTFLKIKVGSGGRMQSNVAKGRAFEQAVAKALERVGMRQVEVVGGKSDGGVDVRGQLAGVSVGVQCKDWRGKIGPSALRELTGVVGRDGKYAVGVLASRRGFTRECVALARKTRVGLLLMEVELGKTKVKMMGNQMLLRQVEGLAVGVDSSGDASWLVVDGTPLSLSDSTDTSTTGTTTGTSSPKSNDST